VASIVFGQPAPIVDANVRRVVLRIDGRETPETDARRTGWVWERAGALVSAASDPGAFNEGLMELGAKVCAPRAPKCGECPIASDCRARARSAQHRIPAIGPKPERPRVVHQVVVIRDRSGRFLVEQRPPKGMWAGLWQFPTREAAPPGLRSAALRAWAEVPSITPIGRFSRTTTHRVVEFEVWRAAGAARLATRGRTWAPPGGELAGVAFSVPHRLIASRVMGGGDDGAWGPISPRKMAGPAGLC
jgi:A/G-specific adenine glycosylase